jgi:hypothetical protein
MSNVLPGPLTNLSAWVGFCTSTHSRVANINFDIWIVLGGSYEYLMKNYQLTAKFFLIWALHRTYCPRLLTDVSA